MTVYASSGAHGVLRHPKPVLRRAALPLEVGRGQRPVRPDALEHAVGHRGVLGEGRGVEAGPLAAPVRTEPRELARRNERQRLVGRLEDLTAFVEQVAPGGLVVGDARVQHEVVVAAGDLDRVELDRPELPEDLEHPVEASLDRPRGCEEVPCDEKPPRRLSSDLHLEDTNCAYVGQLTTYAHRCSRRSPTGLRVAASRSRATAPQERRDRRQALKGAARLSTPNMTAVPDATMSGPPTRPRITARRLCRCSR